MAFADPKKAKAWRNGIFHVLHSNITATSTSTSSRRSSVGTATDVAAARQYKVRRKQGPREVHREINRVFPSEAGSPHTPDKYRRQSDVDRLILRYLPDFNQASMATLMHRSAKEWKRTKTSLLARHLPAITAYMSYLPAHEWSPREISQAIYGLQYMKSDDRRVLKYLSVMTTIVSSSLGGESVEFYDDDEDEEEDDEGTFLDDDDEGDEEDEGDNDEEEGLSGAPLTLIPTSFSLSVFRDTTEQILAQHLLSQDGDDDGDDVAFTAKEVTTILYSLRGMRSDVNEVRGFLGTFNSVVERSKEGFDAQGAGNALYGLQGMSSEYPVVRRLVSLVSRRVEGCTEPLDAQAIGNALYGLRSMRSEHAEVRALVRVLATLIRRSDAAMRPQEVANALYGLQGMSDKHEEVRELLVALEEKVLRSRAGDGGSLGPTELGASLYGFQRMSGDCPEVRALLAAVTTKMLNFKMRLNAQAVGNALWGLQGMGSGLAEVRHVVQVLVRHVRAADPLDAQAVSNALFGLQRMSTASAEVCQLLSALAVKIEYCAQPLSKQEVDDAVVGLQGLLAADDADRPSAELQGLLSAFARQIKRCKEYKEGEPLAA